MDSPVSTNTQAILLLTAPLITGNNGGANAELLTPGEYRRFARLLRDLGQKPADLLGNSFAEVMREVGAVIPADRIRGFWIAGF